MFHIPFKYKIMLFFAAPAIIIVTASLAPEILLAKAVAHKSNPSVSLTSFEQ